MNIGDLAVIRLEAEGYYSNSYVRCEVVVEKDFLEKHIEDFRTVYFNELDGKHSEIEADLNTFKITEDNLKVVVEYYLGSEGDEYVVWEQLMDGIDEDEVNRQIEVNRKWNQMISQKTKYYFNGKEL